LNLAKLGDGLDKTVTVMVGERKMKKKGQIKNPVGLLPRPTK
jgi:hypothetical protein